MTDEGNKIIKCRCRATGRYFVIEVRRSGGVWAAVNFVDIGAEDAAHIASEVYPEEVYTASNLLPCSKNGTRKVASCSLVKTPCGRCANSGRYSIDCIYCTELVRDNTGVRGPYTKWAGISNIPGVGADRFGNPQGSSYDLAQDGAFSGYTIVWIDLTPVSNLAAKARAALGRKGFRVEVHHKMPSRSQLAARMEDGRGQLWLTSSGNRQLTAGETDMICECYRAGHGVYIWGDNAPLFADANAVLGKLFGCTLSGDDMCSQVLGISSAAGKPGIIPDHLITTGIVSFYEGITISSFAALSGGLKPLIYSSAGKIVSAYSEGNGCRLLADGGFTRLFHKWDTAGTDRYVTNAAAWLANTERWGYMPA